MPYTVEALHVGDGVTTQFGFNFDYQKPVHVIVSVDGVDVAYTFLSPNTVQITPAPGAGTTVRIYRDTPLDTLNHQFQLGAPFLPAYIDDNNFQVLYAAQESRATSAKASAAADTAVASAAQANLTADGAVVTANTSLSTANAASAASTQAVATATAALNTANAATTTANSASSTATAAANAAQAAVTTANAANTAAQQANATATAAISTANSAAAASASATTTANNALATANNALATANSASTAAASAVDTAGMALEVAEGIEAKADTALGAATQASADAAAALGAVAKSGVGAFNGRSGLVVPLAGDYSADMISVGSSDVATELANKAPATHTHAISQVSGLTAALGSKASVVDLQASNQNLTDQILQLQNTDAALNTRLTTAESDILARVRLSGGVTGAAELPVGSTAQRPTPVDGYIRYNSETVCAELYTGALWQALWDTRMLRAPAGTLDMSASSFLRPGSFGIGEAHNLGPLANLDNVQRSGFYRLQNGHDPSVEYGQMIVSRGGDTMLQLLAGFRGRLMYRTGTVGAGGVLTAWHDLTPTFGTKDTTPGRSIKNGDRQTIAAWVNFFGSGSVTIRGQYGIASVTRVQQGVYDIWFSTPFTNDWYNVQALSGRGTSVGGTLQMNSVAVVSTQPNMVRIEVLRESNGLRVHTDSDYIYVTIIGALDNTPEAP